MFFTTNDFLKIQKWLSDHTLTTPSLPYANMPLSGNELFRFSQDGYDRVINISELVKQLNLLGGYDILNITTKYNKKYITLKEAINLAPVKFRKLGQLLTFLNKEGNWGIYQFRGESLTQWLHTSCWYDVFEDSIIDSYLPDEEHLTLTPPNNKGVSKIKLKNKKYDPSNFSGKGKIYLSKNIVPIKNADGEKVSINILTQDKLVEENTIYVVQYDFNLNGKTITLPSNSILDFDGGSITNGTIQLNSIKIKNSPVILEQVFPECILEGYFSSDTLIFDPQEKGFKYWDGSVWRKLASNII